MKHVDQHVNLLAVVVEEVSTPAMKPGGLLVQTHFCAISPGIEQASVSSGSGSLLSKTMELPIWFESLATTTRITFNALNTLRKGVAVSW